jgi:four helix bundle protein
MASSIHPQTQLDFDHDDVRLDFQKLDCYRVALELNALVSRFVSRGHRELRDQLNRAALSIPLNIAEATGRRSLVDRARFLSIARGSAMECAAIVDVLVSTGLASLGACREARVLLVRIVRMVTKLEARRRADAA